MLNFPEERQAELLHCIQSGKANLANITVYGEAYGGKMQGMKNTYGPDLLFIAFEVLIGESWLTTDRADAFCQELGIEFVPWERGPATIEWLNEQRDRDSIVAIRRGIGPGKKREGVVIHPVMELVYPKGEGRIIAKHKRDDFAEFAHQPKVEDGKAKMIFEAEQICDQWVVPLRLEHVLDTVAISKGISVNELSLTNMKEIIAGMVEDLEREGEGEIAPSPQLNKVIGNRTVKLFKEYLQRKIGE